MSRLSIGLVGAVCLALAGCGGGGGSGGSSGVPTGGSPPSPPPVTFEDPTFDTAEGTAHFLNQSTFGATQTDIEQLTGDSSVEWFKAELQKPASLYLPMIETYLTQTEFREDAEGCTYPGCTTPTFAFWKNAVSGDDQLRQRMGFALSQIIVVSHLETTDLFSFPEAVGYYQDILTRNAFGNYRDILEEVTYSPAMGLYLTYYQNAKGDPDSGRMPDENYAREIMQLFTIGLVELNMDGTVRLDANGDAIETYDNDDVTGLAKVFTGLSQDSGEFFNWIGEEDVGVRSRPMQMYPEWHSDDEKRFLGVVIPAGTSGQDSIDQALDALFEHPNVAPFVSRQLIQRFTTSSPTPAYVERVATAFETGAYALPDGDTVGTGQRGDLAATVAAILFDAEARDAGQRANPQYGKLREPVVRFVHWARAFDANRETPEKSFLLYNALGADALAQHPYKSPSVFNFYRPGYVAPRSETGAAGLTAPELQIVNATSISGYANFMTYFALGFAASSEEEGTNESYLPDYNDEMALAGDIDGLIEHLNLVLAHGSLTDRTKDAMRATLSEIPLENPDDPDYNGPFNRAAFAVLMVMTSQDYIVIQ